MYGPVCRGVGREPHVAHDLTAERLGSTLPGACAHDHAVTRRLLAGSGFDAERTIGYLIENGGTCELRGSF